MKSHDCDAFLREFKEKLSELLDGEHSNLSRLQETVPFIRKQLESLKSQLLQYPFEREFDEIAFFKTVKPSVQSELIFELERFSLLNNVPVAPVDGIKSYLNDELKVVGRFFQNNAFHYQYYKLNFTELDQQYFLRSAGHPNPLVEIPGIDPQFSTSLDYLLAKFMAYEKLQQLILEELSVIESASTNVSKESKTTKKLKWTGDSINLAEMAYGIWLTGQIDNGNASIASIIKFLEEVFDIKVGRPYRRWQAIASRKRLSATNYLDEMKQAIIRRLDDENGK